MSNTGNPFPGLRVEWRAVTPKYASRLLKQNTRNRRLRTTAVARYAIDMLGGHWGFSDSAIIIADDGSIINGQHRLHAVVSSRCEIWSVIVRNLPVTAIRDFDQNLRRSIPDAINLAQDNGWKVTNRSVGVAKFLMGKAQTGSYTHHTVHAYMERHKDAIQFAEEAFGSHGVRGVTRAPVLAAVARAAECGEDRDRMREFAAVLVSGESNGKKDSAAIKLRNWLVNAETQDAGKKPSRGAQFRKTESALAAFLKGERLTRLYEASKELWPLADDE